MPASPPRSFVDPDFEPPAPPPAAAEGFVLTPLLVAHSVSDLAAWSSSVEHIHATPGFEEHRWPDEPMTLERNRDDLQRHQDDFAARRGFTYTVLDRTDGEVVGCVYIYPSRDGVADANVRSWVRADRPDLDVALWRTVTDWLDAAWPFATVDYAARPGA
jgi:hypothetical protein